jgi:hypothetical protein
MRIAEKIGRPENAETRYTAAQFLTQSNVFLLIVF